MMMIKCFNLTKQYMYVKLGTYESQEELLI